MDTGNNHVTIPAMVCEDLGIDDTVGIVGTAGELTITVSDWAGSGSSVDLVVDASQFYDVREPLPPCRRRPQSIHTATLALLCIPAHHLAAEFLLRLRWGEFRAWLSVLELLLHGAG